MPDKNPATERIGGPGASHENRKHPEKSKPRGPHPAEESRGDFSSVSGGGGEADRHHERNAPGKGGR